MIRLLMLSLVMLSLGCRAQVDARMNEQMKAGLVTYLRYNCFYNGRYCADSWKEITANVTPSKTPDTFEISATGMAGEPITFIWDSKHQAVFGESYSVGSAERPKQSGSPLTVVAGQVFGAGWDKPFVEANSDTNGARLCIALAKYHEKHPDIDDGIWQVSESFGRVPWVHMEKVGAKPRYVYYAYVDMSTLEIEGVDSALYPQEKTGSGYWSPDMGPEKSYDHGYRIRALNGHYTVVGLGK